MARRWRRRWRRTGVTNRWILGLKQMVNQSPNTRNERRLRFCIRLSIGILLALHLSPDYVFPDIIFLAKVEEFSDLRCTLGTEAFGDDSVRQSGNFILALFN